MIITERGFRMKNEIINLKTITYKGKIYILKEDVVRTIVEFGVTEVTDVRHRAEVLACKIEQLSCLAD